MTEHVHTVVIGAGVVGLAIARRLAPSAGELLVLERGNEIGGGTSSRNSEVIHAGMYYAAGSRKARSCVAGRRQLVAWCRERGVSHAILGKLIVASDDAQCAQLQVIAERARANGLVDEDEALQWLDRGRLQALEPELEGRAALLSPCTGIIDTHGLMLSFQADAEAHGGFVSLRTAFVGARVDGAHWRVFTRTQDGDEYELLCTHLVNAAGLQAQQVARRIEGLAPGHVPAPLWLKGNYFTVSGKQPPFGRLVYPVPSGGGLGVHLTLDLGGQARFGPDTEALAPRMAEQDAPDFRVDPARAEVFYQAIRRYWPGLADGSLQPAYAGIRPKLAQGGTALDANDFDISGPVQHGLPGLVQLFGIESPGITASMALADDVAKSLQGVAA